MQENNNSEVSAKKTYMLEELFEHTLIDAIYKEVMTSRTYAKDDIFTYAPIEKTKNDKTYVITPRHVSVKECMTFANSSCKKCWGTGRKIMEIDKGNVPNVEDFIMIASVPLDGLSEEQKKIAIEKEKAFKFWKILLPCSCTLKKMIKMGKHIVNNDMNNIIIEITCTEKTME